MPRPGANRARARAPHALLVYCWCSHYNHLPCTRAHTSTQPATCHGTRARLRPAPGTRGGTFATMLGGAMRGAGCGAPPAPGAQGSRPRTASSSTGATARRATRGGGAGAAPGQCPRWRGCPVAVLGLGGAAWTFGTSSPTSVSLLSSPLLSSLFLSSPRLSSPLLSSQLGPLGQVHRHLRPDREGKDQGW